MLQVWCMDWDNYTPARNWNNTWKLGQESPDIILCRIWLFGFLWAPVLLVKSPCFLATSLYINPLCSWCLLLKDSLNQKHVQNAQHCKLIWKSTKGVWNIINYHNFPAKKKTGGPQTYISTKGVWSKIDYHNFPPKKTGGSQKYIIYASVYLSVLLKCLSNPVYFSFQQTNYRLLIRTWSQKPSSGGNPRNIQKNKVSTCEYTNK